MKQTKEPLQLFKRLSAVNRWIITLFRASKSEPLDFKYSSIGSEFLFQTAIIKLRSDQKSSQSFRHISSCLHIKNAE